MGGWERGRSEKRKTGRNFVETGRRARFRPDFAHLPSPLHSLQEWRTQRCRRRRHRRQCRHRARAAAAESKNAPKQCPARDAPRPASPRSAPSQTAAQQAARGNGPGKLRNRRSGQHSFRIRPSLPSRSSPRHQPQHQHQQHQHPTTTSKGGPLCGLFLRLLPQIPLPLPHLHHLPLLLPQA